MAVWPSPGAGSGPPSTLLPTAITVDLTPAQIRQVSDRRLGRLVAAERPSISDHDEQSVEVIAREKPGTSSIQRAACIRVASWILVH